MNRLLANLLFGNAGKAIAIVVITFILTIAATIAAYIFIIPESKREKLNGFGKWLHDFFNLKGLWIESILRVLYVFLTIYFVISGFITLFSSFLGGLAMMIIVPIFLRLSFEMLFLTILLVKNVIEINNHLKGVKADPFGGNANSFVEKLSAKATATMNKAPAAPIPPVPPVAPAAPVPPVAPAPVEPPVAPEAPASPVCPNCGKPVAEGSAFCTQCGTPLNK